MELMEHQLKVIDELGNGKILYGIVGSGKTVAALAYYMKYEALTDKVDDDNNFIYRHIYVITTAKKRDSLDWEGEAARFGIGTEEDGTVAGIITVDSFNNIGKYTDIEDAFFIFDEQRLIGTGEWVKSFYKIAEKNRWIMLSGTPGDKWEDYAPVFIANGFYRNITEFRHKHIDYMPFVRYRKVRNYRDERKLEVLRNDILVEMPFVRKTKRYLNWTPVGYDSELFRQVYKKRWNIYEDKPVKDIAEVFRLMRRVVNSDPSRLQTIKCLMEIHPKLIIWYNWNYELDILRTLGEHVDVYEWNGHKHEQLPESDKHDSWVYLVQYVAGAEGWNCVDTDAMVMYSLTYSYRYFEQAQGRIDRLDTPFTDLRYYILYSNSLIDKGIKNALDNKKNFNERKFAKKIMKDW